jgi:hypothetical protein
MTEEKKATEKGRERSKRRGKKGKNERINKWNLY